MSREPQTGPIAGATAQLLSWLSRAGVTANVGLPDGTSAAYVWPLAVLPVQTLRTTGGDEPLRLRVRHLITVDSPAAEGTGALDLVLAGAAEDSDFPLVIEPIPADVWSALGISPRLGLLVDVQAHVTRTRRTAPRVRSALRMDHVPMRSMRGRVVGPEGVPMSGIRVQAAGTESTTYTDSGGHFVLNGLLSGRASSLLLSGRGLRFHAEVAETATEPVVITCALEED